MAFSQAINRLLISGSIADEIGFWWDRDGFWRASFILAQRIGKGVYNRDGREVGATEYFIVAFYGEAALYAKRYFWQHAAVIVEGRLYDTRKHEKSRTVIKAQKLWYQDTRLQRQVVEMERARRDKERALARMGWSPGLEQELQGAEGAEEGSNGGDRLFPDKDLPWEADETDIPDRQPAGGEGGSASADGELEGQPHVAGGEAGLTEAEAG